MKDLKRVFNIATIGSIIMDIIAIILGIFLISNPEIGTKSALTLIGIILIASGLYAILKFILNTNRFFMFEIIYGILSIIAGIIAITNPFGVTNFITILAGIWLMISAVSKFVLSIQFRKLNESSWIFDLSIALINIILAVLLITNPFASFIILTTYVGIMIIVYAGIDIVDQLLIRKRASIIVDLLKGKNSVK